MRSNLSSHSRKFWRLYSRNLATEQTGFPIASVGEADTKGTQLRPSKSIKHDTIAALRHAEQRSIKEVSRTIADFTYAAQEVRKLAEDIPTQFRFQRSSPLYKIGKTAARTEKVIANARGLVAQTVDIRAHLQYLRNLPYPDLEHQKRDYDAELESMRKEKKDMEVDTLKRDEDELQCELKRELARLKQMCDIVNISVTSGRSSGIQEAGQIKTNMNS